MLILSAKQALLKTISSVMVIFSLLAWSAFSLKLILGVIVEAKGFELALRDRYLCEVVS